jgi:hypothetical protein
MLVLYIFLMLAGHNLLILGNILYYILTAPVEMLEGSQQNIVGEVWLSTWLAKEELKLFSAFYLHP